MNEAEVMDSQLIPYDGSYDISGNGEDLSSDAIWYPCPFFNPISAQDEFLHDFSSYWNDENVLAEETDGEEELPFYGCGNWLGEYEHSGECWGDSYFSIGNEIHKNEGDRELEIENSNQTEQQHESSFRHEEASQEDQSACDLNPWSFDFWFAYGAKTDSHDYSRQEARIRNSYDLPEIGVCESIFGYWPCLYR